MTNPRLPNDKQRLAILGRTGSGKSLAALWHLSNAGFDRKPWLIVDFKTDEHINSIDRAKYISTKETPKNPGIYIVQPHPQDGEALAGMLQRVWEKENIGVWIDEGYMMSESPAVEKRFVSLLTQGRSKRIPMIVLSQRPVWISRFVFSESDFYQIFQLQDKRDVQTIASFIPPNTYIRLPDYHSIYYDVGRNDVSYLAPVPSEDSILEKIDTKLKPIRKTI